MADKVMAKNTDAKYTPHPEGQYAARCVDVIALGEKVEQYQDYPAKIVSKCALIFRTGEKNEEGHLIDLAPEFTVSMGERANLRKFLEGWRGKPYTDEQADEGVPIDKLEGHPALVSVAHKRSRNNRTYAVIQTIMPLPKGMPAPPESSDYKRAEYWADRKKEYAEGVSKFKAASMGPPSDFDDFPPPTDDDSELPF